MNYTFFSKKNDNMSANEEKTSLQPTQSPCPNLDSCNDSLFHAVFVPRGDEDSTSEDHLHVYADKIEALKVIKKYKNARLKTFKSQNEAKEYAYSGYASVNSVSHSLNVVPNIPRLIVTEEKSNDFKSLKPQELVRFRKLIESGDVQAVKKAAWENPRFLVSSGDTPAILQEGCRYNALHIAVKTACSPEMCEMILNTVGDTQFVRLMYGEEERKCYLDRAEILLDLYLNTPDKVLNETPLHFAVKYGLKDVTRVLVSYRQCVKTLRNKYNCTPAEIICTRKYQEDEALKREILMLLEEQFYVPVLRSEDNTLQPVIGEPFSPTSPPQLNLDPISPRVEVRAFAGPMSKNQASEFRRKWKTPPRICSTPNKKDRSMNESFTFMNSPNVNARLQDTEKGLERIGRDLAVEYHVPWKEYWPFLDDFEDLRSIEGLAKLEKFLQRRYSSFSSLDLQGNAVEVVKKQGNVDTSDGINMICNKLEKCLLGATDGDSEDDLDNVEFFTPPSSPELSDSSSEDEMCMAEEGDAMFIEGNVPTKVDNAVYNTISSISITPDEFPYVYRWRHQMKHTLSRDSLRFKNSTAIRRKLLMTP